MQKTALSKFFLIFLFAFIFTGTSFAAPGGKGGGSGSGPAPSTCDDHIDNDGDGYCDFSWKKAYCSDGSIVGDTQCASRYDAEGCQPTSEICDGIDNDCDTLIDENNVCSTDYYCDEDQDGHLPITPTGSCSTYQCIPSNCQDNAGFDCADDNALINPSIFENCDNDLLDNDCDGIVDECDHCIDGIISSDETDIDCGGSCQRCDIGQSCQTDADCITSKCDNLVCGETLTNLHPDCRPLKYDNSNNLQNHMNVVFVPSGFNGDMALFGQKVQWIFSIFQNYMPFKSEVDRLNVFYTTQEQGDLGCYFNCSGIARLLCCNVTKAKSASSICTDGPRQTVVIHNSATYGGAGYRSSDVATTSIHPSAPKIAIHELGHSAFNLGDEYNASSTSLNSANCDNAGCAKWADMIGYNGVSCIPNACAGGKYYTAEISIMKSLSYLFEEVNLRASCCAYFNETGTYPDYCVQFDQFASSQNLEPNCFDFSSSSVSAAPLVFVHKPVQVTFSKEGASWVQTSASSLRPGRYPISQVKGQTKGNVSIDITFEDDSTQKYILDDTEEVEFPEESNRMGGYISRPRSEIEIIIETRGKKVVRNIKIFQRQAIRLEADDRRGRSGQ